MKPHICKTCRFAEWQRGETGRVLTGSAGRCRFVPFIALCPNCIDREQARIQVQLIRIPIYRGNESPCPCWEGL